MVEIILTDEQEVAKTVFGNHARLLAGPGTGKTLVITERVKYLINEMHVPPKSIAIITFTRAASNELRNRIQNSIGEDNPPEISTLHSFALSQLLKNQDKISKLTIPLRIADDWDEKNIILPDIKALMGESSIDNVKEHFKNLSSGWDSLIAEEDIEVDPKFIGAWEMHRFIFGYTLRSELVYQLKLSLEYISDFKLNPNINYLIVDEYQDLNKCDLEIIKYLEGNGVELFVAGDDDQSIYGFRNAHPIGIRNFISEFDNVDDLGLSICKRCDPNILELAEKVAKQDATRIEKKIESDHSDPEGIVRLINYTNQYEEANGIAKICKSLIQNKNLHPDNILILSRTDRYKVFSNVLRDAFSDEDIPFSSSINDESPLFSKTGIQILSILRLLRNRRDHLSWKTLLISRNNSIGKKRINLVLNNSIEKNIQFFDALERISQDELLTDINYQYIKNDFEKINGLLDSLFSMLEEDGFDDQNEKSLISWLPGFIEGYFRNPDISAEIIRVIDFEKNSTVNSLLSSIEVSNIDIEQEIEKGKVNFLTMHKAKGLTSEAVFIIGCENENIPGKQTSGNLVNDERRLFYVSLTRAKHYLFLTYCDQRIDAQRYTGASPGKKNRQLTDFLLHLKLEKEESSIS